MGRNQKNKTKGNGEGTIYVSSKTGLLVGQYCYNGKRKSVYQKKNEKTTDFKKRFSKILTEINEGTYIEKNDETFSSILKNHIDQKYKDGTTSDRGYKRDLDTFKAIEKTCNNFINKAIQKVTLNDINLAKELIKNYSKSSIDKIWRLINKTFKIAISRRLIVFNIMEDEDLKKPISKKDTKHVESLTVDEEKKLVDILNNEEKHHKYRNILLLQLNTGMRIGEVLALSKDCIDLKNKTITVYRTLTRDLKEQVIMGKTTKTGEGGVRTFPMTDATQKIITDVMKSKIFNIHNLLFWDYTKSNFVTPSQIDSYLVRLNKKYKIANNISSHVLRHTFITRCVENGMFIKAIQKIVGHKPNSSITVDVYTSVSNDFVLKELEKIK